MGDPIAIRETINEARFAINQAAKTEPGRRALEGNLESAFLRIGDALAAIEQGEDGYAREAVAEAVELLRMNEAGFIATDFNALDGAIGLLAGIGCVIGDHLHLEPGAQRGDVLLDVLEPHLARAARRPNLKASVKHALVVFAHGHDRCAVAPDSRVDRRHDP